MVLHVPDILDLYEFIFFIHGNPMDVRMIIIVYASAVVACIAGIAVVVLTE
jgi:hypothetical protein